MRQSATGVCVQVRHVLLKNLLAPIRGLHVASMLIVLGLHEIHVCPCLS